MLRRSPASRALLVAVALSPLIACGSAAPVDPVVAPDAARVVRAADNPNASARVSPHEQGVLDAMVGLKAAIVASDTVALKRIWTDDYNFIDARGRVVTRAQRLVNFASGATDVAVIDNEREITVRVYGDMAIVQNLSTLRGQFSGQPTDTDLRGMFMWVRRDGRWRLLTNELTPVIP